MQYASLEQLHSNLECDLPCMKANSIVNYVLLGYDITELRICENHYLLFLSIYSLSLRMPHFLRPVAKKLDPPILIPPVQNYRNIWTPGTKMFEIFGPQPDIFIPFTKFIYKLYFHSCIRGPYISPKIIAPPPPIICTCMCF